MTRDYEQELANINNTLAESVLTASDEEIEEEIRAEGLDPAEEAAHVRGILLDAVGKYKSRASIRCHKCKVWVRVEDDHPCFASER